MRDRREEIGLAFTHGGNVIIVPEMLIASAGDRGLLVTLPGASAAHLQAASRRIREIKGVVAAIVGQESIYVIGTTDRDAVESAVSNPATGDRRPATEHRVEVSFAPRHALDFEALLSRAGEPREAVIDRISRLTLTARYLGFRAGFAYLEGWPAEWALPRRPTSRNLVPGGSFGVAGVMAGFYPVDSPGGWNILGRTDSLPRFAPGDEIHVVPVDRPLTFSPPRPGEPEGEAVADVIAPGQLTSVIGARDWSRLEEGETANGPFDEEAASIANRAAGNPEGAPLLECVLVGPRLRFRIARRVAWCGATCEPRAWNVRAGEEVDIGRIRDGFRGYLAIEGGVTAMTKMLWSGQCRAAGLGGRGGPRPYIDRLTIHVMPGPHDAPPLPEVWEVTPHMNRVGIRLRPLKAVNVKLPAELPSCGMQFGTLQWHPDGSVVAMGPDAPVTGGYLQPATIISTELWKLGQLAPGERVRLIAV